MYELSWAYSSHTYNSQVACIKAFTILNEISTNLNLNVSFEGNNPANITAIVHDQYGNLLKSGKVRFNVNEVDYWVDVVNGVAKLPYYFTNVFNNIYAQFESMGYISSVNYTSFDLEKSNLGFDFNVIRTVNNVTLDIIAFDKINNDALLSINEIEYPIKFANGRYSLNLTNLKNGLYNITLKITFPNDSIYVDDILNSSFIIDIKNTTILADDLIITDEDNIGYNISLLNENGNAVSNKSIELILDGKTYNATTDANGQAIIPIKLNPGIYSADIIFRGDNDYLNSNISTNIKVIYKIDIGLDVLKYANNVTLSINLSKPVNDTLTIRINNKTEEIELINGFKILELFNLNNGIYDVNVGLNDSMYVFDEFSTRFIVDVKNTRIISNDVIMSDEDCLNYTVILLDEFNNTLSNKSIEFVLAGETYAAITDIGGCAFIPVKLASGNYVSEIKFNGDADYFKTVSSNTFTVKPRIDINLTTQKDANNVLVMVKLSKRITGYLTLYVNNQSKTLKVVNGMAKYQLSDLENGDYMVSVLLDDHYIFNEVSSSFSIDMDNTQILANDLIMNDENPINYTVYLVDDEGNGIFNKSLEVILNEIRYDFVTDEYGQIIIPLNLKSGIYSLRIAFKGDDDYLMSSNSTTIIVKSQVNISLAVDKFANSVNLTFNLSKSINDTLIVLINNNTYEINVIGSLVSLNLSDLDNGVYDIAVDLDSSCYDFNHVDGQFVVDVKKSLILIDNLVVNDEELVDYNVTLVDEDNNPIANRSIRFNLNGTIQDIVTDVNGSAVFPVKLNPGSYDVNVIFEGDDSYFKSSNVSSINVKTKLGIDLSIGKFANNVTLTFNLSKAINDKLTLRINNESYGIDVVEGIASLNLFNLANDIYNVEVSLNESVYDYNELRSQFIIDVKQSKIIAFDLETIENNLCVFNATLLDDCDNPISNRSIDLMLNGNNHTQITDENGQISIVFNLTGGFYEIKSIFNGDDDYFESSSINRIKVKSIVCITIGYDKLLNDYIIWLNSSNPRNETLIVKVNNETYFVNVNNYSNSIILNNLSNGIYNVAISLNDTADYYLEECHSQFVINTVPSKIISNDLIVYHNIKNTYSVLLTDNNGNALSNKSILFNLNGNKTKTLTDSNGYASIDFKLPVGEYNIFVSYLGDSYEYYGCKNVQSISVKSTIIGNDSTTKTYNSKYSVELLDGNGNSLVNSNISYIIDNVEHVKATDSQGCLNIDILQKPGDYNLTIINPLNNESFNKTIHVAARISQNKDLTMYEYGGNCYKVRVFDDDGNIAQAGEIVQMKIKGVTYNVKTTGNGYASLKINLKNGKYTVITRYKGYKVSNKITVKPVLTAKNISVKKGKIIKFQAKLVSNKGKVLKGKKITFKFMGKKYIAKTDKNGIATIKIKINLKVGSYKIYTSYNKSKVTNAIKIKK